MAENDGGSAFPKTGNAWNDQRGDLYVDEGASGMSLRDYFAAKAMAGMLYSMANADCHNAAVVKAKKAGILLHEGLAISAYAHADAMLAERSKP